MRKIALLIDPPREIEHVDLNRHDLEGYTPLEVQKMLDAISTFTTHSLYTDTSQFIEEISLHKQELVFPMVWGRGSRNTKAVLPAICEAEQIAYIGADAYTQMLCYDKYLAKKYAEAFGFKTPSGFMLFRSQQDNDILRLISYLQPPIVIKPNFGGGSCGISEHNLVDSHEEAFKIAEALFSSGYDPLLAEEYIAGKEISILLLGNKNSVSYCGETQLVLDGTTFFEHRIWGYETKKLDFQRSHYQVCNLLDTNEYNRAKELFLSLPKAEYLRVDGRLYQGNYYVLELSADCYLGPNGDFSTLFENMGMSHADLLCFLAENALLAHDAWNSPIA